MIFSTVVESSSLLAGTGTWTPPVKPGDKIQETGQFEIIKEGDGGDDAESKQHHYWDVWDD